MKYIPQELLGVGSFGKVYRGVAKHGNRVVAMKKIELVDNEEDIEDLKMEIEILKQISHENVTRLITDYATSDSLWIVMEYCGGGSCEDLIRYVRSKHQKEQGLDEDIVIYITQEFLKGLQYLHKNKMIHRDVKAANVLITSRGGVKLGDFGVSAQLTCTIQQKNTQVGTPWHMSPEILRGEPYGVQSDIWSAGITIIELACGAPPHHQSQLGEAIMLIAKCKPPTDYLAQRNHSQALNSIANACLVRDKAMRPSADYICKMAEKIGYMPVIGRMLPKHHLRNLIAGSKKAKRTQNLQASIDVAAASPVRHGGAAGAGGSSAPTSSLLSTSASPSASPPTPVDVLIDSSKIIPGQSPKYRGRRVLGSPGLSSAAGRNSRSDVEMFDYELTRSTNTENQDRGIGCPSNDGRTFSTHARIMQAQNSLGSLCSSSNEQSILGFHPQCVPASTSPQGFSPVPNTAVGAAMSRTAFCSHGSDNLVHEADHRQIICGKNGRSTQAPFWASITSRILETRPRTPSQREKVRQAMRRIYSLVQEQSLTIDGFSDDFAAGLGCK